MPQKANATDGSSGRIPLIVPIHDPSVPMARIVEGLKRVGMDVKHVFDADQMTERKITGTIHADSLPKLREIPGIGPPRLEETYELAPNSFQGRSGPGLA